jgi:hypothetical protein
VKFVKLKRTQSVCKEKERKREKERKNREKIKFFLKKNELPPKKLKNKIKKMP